MYLMCGVGYFADQFGLCTIPLPDPVHCANWQCDSDPLSALAHQPPKHHRQSLPLEFGILLGFALNTVLLALLLLAAVDNKGARTRNRGI